MLGLSFKLDFVLLADWHVHVKMYVSTVCTYIRLHVPQTETVLLRHEVPLAAHAPAPGWEGAANLGRLSS